MKRRAAARAVLAPLLATLAMSAGTVALPARAAAATVPEPPPPPVTVDNEFLPDDRDIGDCLGALERPGCGSSARGGWHQTTVFVVMLAGLAVVIGRIAVGVRRNRQRPSEADA